MLHNTISNCFKTFKASKFFQRLHSYEKDVFLKNTLLDREIGDR